MSTIRPEEIELSAGGLTITLDRWGAFTRIQYRDSQSLGVERNENQTPIIFGQTILRSFEWAGQVLVTAEEYLNLQELEDLQRVAIATQQDFGITINDRRELIAERTRTRPVADGATVTPSATGGVRYYPKCKGLLTELSRVDQPVRAGQRLVQLRLIELDKLPI